MAIPISTYIDVTVNLLGQVADAFGFGVPMSVATHNVTANRQDGPFFSVAEGEAAGFTAVAAPKVNADLVVAFSQTPTVDSVMVGRRIPSGGGLAAQVWQVDDAGPTFVDVTAEYNSDTDADWIVFPATEAIGDYAAIGMGDPFTQVSLDNLNGTAGIGGVVDWEYWNGSAWTALTGVVDGTTDFTIAVADGQVVTWTVPVDWMPTSLNGETAQYYVRAAITTVYATNPIYDQGHTGEDADLTASLSAINAWDPTTWYGTVIDTRTDADIALFAAWLQANGNGDFPKIGVAQTASAGLLNGTASNIGETLRLASYNRIALMYHALDADSLDMGWMARCLAFNLDGEKGVGDWAYKEVAGPAGDNLNGTQVNNIQTENASFFGPAKGKTFTFDGKVAKGAPQFLDTITTADWVKVRSQEKFIAARVGALTMIGYDDIGLQFLGGKFQEVADQGVRNGHFVGPEGGAPNPTVTVPRFQDVSAEDQANREASMSVSAIKRNSILKVNLTINVSVTGF